MTAHHDGDVIFCGRENGTVAVYSAQTGGLINELFEKTRHAAILHLEWCACRSYLGVSDRFTRFALYQIRKLAPGQVSVTGQTLSFDFGSSIHQIIFSPDGSHVLVSTSDADVLVSIVDQKQIARLEAESDRKSWMWTRHPGKKQQLLLVSGSQIRIFSWIDLKPEPGTMGIDTVGKECSELFLGRPMSSAQGRHLCLQFYRPRGSTAYSQLILLSSENLKAGVDLIQPSMSYPQLAASIKYIIGVFKTDVLFLDHDGWVCSLKIETPLKESFYTRHFFVPYGWHSVKDSLVMGATEKAVVYMAVKDEIAVFHNGLDNREKIAVGDSDVKVSPSMRSALRRGHSSPA